MTETSASLGGAASTVRFVNNSNETVNATTATIQATDNLIDGDSTDNDVINITSTGAMNAMTAVGIETANVTFGSASGQTAVFTNFSGLKAVNVSGAGAGTITNPDTALVTLNGYTHVATISADLSGTTTGGNADVLNVAISGATHGTTTITQTGLTVTSGTAGTLETLNITSQGASANTFTLAEGANATLSKINVGGAADATVRVANAAVSGKTVDGSGGTGALTLSIGEASAVTTNAFNWTAVDNIVFRDTDTTAHTVAVNSVKSGQKITFASNATDTSASVASATYTAPAASLNVVLDNGKADTAVSLGSFAAQNVTALNLVSAGHATSTSTTAQNVIDQLDGDFTSVVVTGDTSLNLDLNIEAGQTATKTADAARTVVVDASAMTGNAFIDVEVHGTTPSTKVSYTITGTGKNDTIDMSMALASTINGGAGNDVITGSAGKDTINAGSGNDTVIVSSGADVVTLGGGNDTVDFDSVGTAAVKQISAVTVTTTATASGTGNDDTLVVVIDGNAYSYNAGDSTVAATAYATNFVAAHATSILAAHGVAVTVNSADTDELLFTGKADGTAFTVTATDFAGGVGSGTALTIDLDQAPAAALDVDTTITDFAVGDILDVAGIMTPTTVTYHEGTAADVATGDSVIVLTGAAFASVAAAEDAMGNNDGSANAVVVFLNSTTGQAEMYFDADLATDNNLADTAVIATFENITTLTDLASIMSADSFVL